MVTNVAIITIYAGVLISSEIIFLNKETKTLEQIKTKVKSKPIPIAASIDLVVAKAGHVPRIETNNGFSAIMPFRKFFLVKPFSLAIVCSFQILCSVSRGINHASHEFSTISCSTRNIDFVNSLAFFD